ncbi:hypothetical protein TKK_0012792 [Trichogramma kaykai]|uniref:Uncharacterized protein n=1 Tax=Trichogramma kaykai TaxID=54128 RepID=A0ABD2WLE3_9HYME
MSSQKGNVKRTRPPKHQNTFAFKNSMHDTSHITKKINSLQIANVCQRCKSIIEWKIKYKKYKPLKQPGKCNKCDQKTVKHAYHTMCGPCARERDACPKCEQKASLVPAQPSKEEQQQLDAEMTAMLRSLPERKRRTFMRYMNGKQQDKKKKKKENSKHNAKVGKSLLEYEQGEEESKEKEDNNDDDDDSDDSHVPEPKHVSRTKQELLEKLNSLANNEDDDEGDADEDNFDSDSSDYDSESDGE